MAPKALTDCPENLRESIDWLVQVKHGGGISKLSSALGKLFDHVAQDAQKSLSSPSESDDPSAGDVVGQLKEFRGSLPKDSSNPNENILYNLCSSFETFLGYKPPGIYDGSGIVYGSASRLCDAILAFFYALFTDVYENQPYVSGRSVLHDVVHRHLKPQLRRGHKGFTHAIPQVADGLRNYNQAVSASNEKVKKPVNELLTYVSEGGKLLTAVNKIQVPEESTPLKPEEAEKAVTAATELVDQCVGEAKKLYRAFDSGARINVVEQCNDLNLSLREKVRNARKNIGYEIKRLNQLSKRERKNLEAFIKMIKQALNKLKTDVNAQITKKVNELVKQLKDKVQDILEQLQKISTSLGQYIMDLDRWIVKTTKDIEAAQNLVQKILDEVNGNANPNNLENLNEAIKKVESKLGESVGDLQAWKQAAEKVLQGTIDKGNDVHKNMDPTQKADGTETQIAKGINQINAAKDAVLQVNTGLQQVHRDLQTWNTTAGELLGKVVVKATEVHKRLQPDGQGPEHKIGTNIKQIGDAKEGIVEANKTLGTQVDNLSKWITDAENIRNAAEAKAKEAYDKLKVNEALDKNVKLIVEAKNRINEVHGKLGGHVGELGKWKTQAGTVLDGAITQATDVYDALHENKQPGGGGQKTELGERLKQIEDAKTQIKTANDILGTEVENLGKWRTAAKAVITKADKKCDEILGKVKTESSREAVIFTQAEELKTRGAELLAAANKAKDEVGKKVKDALQAVVRMDESLKRDLRTVREEIKEGIGSVIETLQVKELGNKVRDDLGTLRDKISGLQGKVGESKNDGSGLVGNELKALQSAKTKLDGIAGESGTIKNALKGMDKLFEQNIKSPLKSAVGAVNEAIVELGGKFTKDDGSEAPKDFNGTFQHIKKQVGKIKGTPGKGDWNNTGASGLEGIKSKVDHYFGEFSEKYKFESIVTGWLDGILGHNGLVKSVLGWQSKRTEEDIKEALKQSGLGGGIREPLKVQAHAAVDVFSGVDANDIQKKITQVKRACELFAAALDEQKLEKEFQSGVLELVKQAKDALKSEKSGSTKGNLQAALAKAECKCNHCGGSRVTDKCLDCQTSDCILTKAIATTVVAVSSVARQVGNELNSVFLNIDDGGNPSDGSIAAILDKITPIAKDLHDNLEAATNSSGQHENKSPAQAVDKRLEEVRDEVIGLVGKFNSQVKQPLALEVEKLGPAVDQFNSNAETQIRAAARTAIDKAAGEIEMEDSAPAEISVKKNMKGFHGVYDHIKNNLESQLQGKVDQHIGTDDSTGGGTGTADKVTLATGNFTHYDKYVTQKSLTTQPLKGELGEGHLPLAIGDIKTQVYNELSMIEPSPSNGKAEITNETFENPVKEISKELDEIAWLVDKSRGKAPSLPQPQPKDEDGIKDHLTKLKNALEQTGFNGVSKQGLDAIKSAIDNLKISTYEQKSSEIDTAVKAIKAQLRELRKKLKNKSGKPEDGVINVLEDLQKVGLEQNTWTPINGKGQKVSGLGKIQGDLEEQNKALSVQNEIIGKSIRAINLELKYLGIRLDKSFHDDDVLHFLEQLQKQIGIGYRGGENLQKIKNEIKKLQSVEFTQKPQAIHEANLAIKAELTTLQGDLQGSPGKEDVMNALNDLKDNGLSGDTWDKNTQGNGKSLKNIGNELQGQQTKLGKQPGNIHQGLTPSRRRSVTH
ncbi:Extracellular matrix-binding ebh, putative [Babesia ovata]|uniref:Extracellular matrix-binding ebh, putative n=1 Tax=Babesia ovata TaxID=189622 RepID=A0A2H6KCQ6_9APIC|nr:Extracellular matrix-binding ebh, putative [Babesia ovata]GBE60772.1 Extracellular matrix-binding ebh, putative [Babesia ovata]